MSILSIDTSCDETSAAVTEGRKVLSNVIYSQVLIHKKWGGVVPSLAKRAHEERIDFVVGEALRKFRIVNKNLIGSELASRSGVGNAHSPQESKNVSVNSLAQASTSSQIFIDNIFKQIDFITVTYGPGLAIALEVGIKKAKELAFKYDKKIIPVNHMEGHIYSCFVQNSRGNPKREFHFPYLALLISGGHTEIVVFKDHGTYEVIGSTLDDAAGEALDKAAKMLGLGYPGGAVIERLAYEAGNKDYFHFPRPMVGSGDLRFSFSGLKTSFYYFLKKMPPEEIVKNIRELASSFQEAVFDTLVAKMEFAIKTTKINRVIVGGGVIANRYLRKKLRQLAKENKGEVVFPSCKYLTGDNAAMIGVAGYFSKDKAISHEDFDKLDRVPRLSL